MAPRGFRFCWIRKLGGASRALAGEARAAAADQSTTAEQHAKLPEFLSPILHRGGAGRGSRVVPLAQYSASVRFLNGSLSGQEDNFGTTAFTSVDRKHSLEPFNPVLNARTYSIVTEKEHVVVEIPSPGEGNSPSGEGAVVLAETEVSVQQDELLPETQSTTPLTPLVEVIQSQDSATSAAAELTSSSSSEAEAKDLGDDGADADGQIGTSPGGTVPSSSSSSVLKAATNRAIHPARVYVGGLPFAMKGDELRNALGELCGAYGFVVDVKLMQHQHQSQKSIDAGKHRGFAFVTMETPDQAQEVIEALNGTTVWGRVIRASYGLKPAVEEGGEVLEQSNRERKNEKVRRKIYVGNLHENTSRLDLAQIFQQHGTVVDVKLITELHTNRSRGFGFVTFAEPEQAMKAVLDKDGSIVDGSVIRVNIAKYPQGY